MAVLAIGNFLIGLLFAASTWWHIEHEQDWIRAGVAFAFAVFNAYTGLYIYNRRDK